MTCNERSYFSITEIAIYLWNVGVPVPVFLQLFNSEPVFYDFTGLQFRSLIKYCNDLFVRKLLLSVTHYLLLSYHHFKNYFPNEDKNVDIAWIKFGVLMLKLFGRYPSSENLTLSHTSPFSLNTLFILE